ncbi:transporter [Salmonella enterica subsp. arizonae]|uniref:Transporter n=1 Tax=Salmonella enterica subsp. arizonae TaxID=59203 RepID=A0A379T2I5_SALER|nr:transporter [Salmonella enterica subsp. arizonae]
MENWREAAFDNLKRRSLCLVRIMPRFAGWVISAWIGNSIEYYDFLLYGLASALVFSPLFFPGASPFTATLSSFASFGVGFISRPLGALFFGNRGDTLGRKNTLLITLGGMGTVTFLIGCLPSYASIGALAPVLLVILRFLQGFLVGGEWGGAMLMVVEYASGKHRGRLSALSQTGGLTDNYWRLAYLYL